MSKIHLFFPSLFVILAELFYLCHADIGTAAHYQTPYQSTACYKSDAGQFPSNNLFGAADEGIWDNDAAGGRKYAVRCISTRGHKCKSDKSIQIKIVDYELTSVSKPSQKVASIVLSKTALRR